MDNDPYRLTNEPTTEPNQPQTNGARLALWVALIVAAGLNAAMSTINPWLGAGFGIIVLALGAMLIVNYRRGRAHR